MGYGNAALAERRVNGEDSQIPPNFSFSKKLIEQIWNMLVPISLYNVCQLIWDKLAEHCWHPLQSMCIFHVYTMFIPCLYHVYSVFRGGWLMCHSCSEAYQELNHRLPFRVWCMDCMYKESGKLCNHFGADSIAVLYKRNDGVDSSRFEQPRRYLRTKVSELSDEQKAADIWSGLAQTDARKTSPLSACTYVLNTEYEFPLEICLTPGLSMFIPCL